MNERIRELAEQAIEDMPGAWNIPDEFCKKFSELILKDCCEILLKWKSEPFPFDEDTAVSLIKEHFNFKG